MQGPHRGTTCWQTKEEERWKNS